ncbi:hypothetical protein [Saliphagus infecundisoli]|uniref:Uncharacterized protein n=1 Tax=Saliphagus infecundisoli TaxID=1849069 RepID=A0ABD5QGT9_9EURY|nr:hypothetical protein [Saliphagus infecundisoli]
MSGDNTRSPSSDASHSRRTLLGSLTGLGTGALFAGTQGANAQSGRRPFAPADYDHSGERGGTNRLGEAKPVDSLIVDRLSAAQQNRVVYVSELPSVSGAGTPDDPYISPSGTAGMREAFDRLNDLGGGVVYYPSGFYGDGTTSWEIDLAEYESLRNNWAIYGDGLESSRIRAGSDDGAGIQIRDSDGTDMFYIEIVGVRFEGDNDGYTFVWGSEDLRDPYNSCFTRFATANDNPDGDGACQINFALNTYHYGVHNSAGGTGLELRRVQFSGLEGSFSSGENEGDVALNVEEYSFGNLFSYLNIEATYDGIHIEDARAIGNVFQNAYFANVFGTAFTQQIDNEDERFPDVSDQGTYFHNPFVAGAVERIAEIDDSAVYVDGSTRRWPSTTVQTYQGDRYGGGLNDLTHVDFEPQSEPPEGTLGRIVLADGDGWDPTGDGDPALVVSTGEEWTVLQALA